MGARRKTNDFPAVESAEERVFVQDELPIPQPPDVEAAGSSHTWSCVYSRLYARRLWSASHRRAG